MHSISYLFKPSEFTGLFIFTNSSTELKNNILMEALVLTTKKEFPQPQLSTPQSSCRMSTANSNPSDSSLLHQNLKM